MCRTLPLAPVAQRATDDVELAVYDDDLGVTGCCWYRPGAAAYLLARYRDHPSRSGLQWQVALSDRSADLPVLQ